MAKVLSWIVLGCQVLTSGPTQIVWIIVDLVKHDFYTCENGYIVGGMVLEGFSFFVGCGYYFNLFVFLCTLDQNRNMNV